MTVAMEIETTLRKKKTLDFNRWIDTI